MMIDTLSCRLFVYLSLKRKNEERLREGNLIKKLLGIFREIDEVCRWKSFFLKVAKTFEATIKKRKFDDL